jgi:hypothetical protein
MPANGGPPPPAETIGRIHFGEREGALEGAPRMAYRYGLLAKLDSLQRSERGFKGGRRSPPLLKDAAT